MSKTEDLVLLNRILAHFERIAPKIVSDSVESLKSEHPMIDYYDIDYYLSKMENDFDDVDEDWLRRVTFENLEEINAVFFKYFKKARADNY